MTIACPDCGALTDLPPLPPRSKAVCRCCDADLEKTSGRSISAALACSFGTLLLLIPSNTLPLLRVDLFGMKAQNLIAGGIIMLAGHGWVLLAGLTAVYVIAFPLLRFALLSMVLGALQWGRRPSWLGPAFRWAVWLDLWAMSDVFLLASFVGYYRLINVSQINVSLEPGGACFIAAAMLTMLSRATLDQRTVWRAIGPEVHVTATTGPTLSCLTCDLVQPLSNEGRPCPRCGARLRTRKTDAMPRTAALLITAFILFFPANVYPMEVSMQAGTRMDYTIFTGVSELFQNHLWPLGILIFCTSILIPLVKILAVAWCALGVWRGSDRHLIARTKAFRIVAELGRWSKTDPFTIVFFVPLMNFGALGSATADFGATAFMLMTSLTMAASSTFDPRLMWDVAGAARDRHG